MAEWEFEAPWSTLLRVISFSAVLVILGIPAFMIAGERVPPDQATTLAVLFPAILLGAGLFTVRGYALSGETLSVRRLLWSTRVDLRDLRSVEVDPEAMKGSIRTLGNGGLFGFTGRYRSRRLGPFRAFVTDFSSCVVLVTGEGTIVVSPSSPESFAEIARGMIHG